MRNNVRHLILVCFVFFTAACGDTEKTEFAQSVSRGTKGLRYFDGSVQAAFRANCTGCHLRGGINGTIYQYRDMFTYLANGGLGLQNTLILKIRNQAGHHHMGGDGCPMGLESSPCKEINVWWGLEFDSTRVY